MDLFILELAEKYFDKIEDITANSHAFFVGLMRLIGFLIPIGVIFLIYHWWSWTGLLVLVGVWIVVEILTWLGS